MAHCNASANSALDTRSVTADTHPVASCVGLPPLLWMIYPAGTASVLWLRGKPPANYRGYVKWKKRRRLLQSKRPIAAERAPQATLPLQKLTGLDPLPSRWTWARGGNHVSGWGWRVVKATTTPPLTQIPLLNRSRRRPSGL